MTDRKTQHIQMALDSQRENFERILTRSGLCYEPLWANHRFELPQYELLGRKLKYPLWISGMTGGSELALEINKDLANLSRELGIGMGLGSCRPYLEETNREVDFMIREYAAQSLLGANLGIAQIAQYIREDKWEEVECKLEKLGTDFLMVHINPAQEWFQTEGDKFFETPFETLKKLQALTKMKIGVKEVGQGFGPKSLQALVDMKVEVIELAGMGGTNFTLLEQMRNEQRESDMFVDIGHDCYQMINWLNSLYKEDENFPMIIISGGVREATQAAILSQLAKFPSMIGMAYPFLKWQKQGRVYLKMKTLEFCNDWAFAMSVLQNSES